MGKRIAVVGGGIAGLAAAVWIRDNAPSGTEIIIFEKSGALGGKLRTGELAGTLVERGPDAFLFGGPTGESPAVRLARRVGIGDEIIHPANLPSALVVNSRLEPIPGGTLVGVPGDVTQLGAVATAETDRDYDNGSPLLAAGADISVGELVRSRFGDQVVDRLVDPMLGGVYAGRADGLSLAVTIPALAKSARVEHTLAGAVRAVQAKADRVPGRPVFASVRGGLRRLVAAAATTSGARIHLNAPVHAIDPVGKGWRLVFGPVPDEVGETYGTVPDLRYDEVDACILAVPADPAARLLHNVDGVASAAVSGIEYASVALVAAALPAGTELPQRSGFLVPATEGTLIKAATFMSRKWPSNVADGPALVRMSIGRAGEEKNLERSDRDLTELALTELGTLIGRRLPTPRASWVQRWDNGLPQYRPGHLDRVTSARAALEESPTIALAGAAYDGVGIPACIASGERAGDHVLAAL